MDAKLKVASSKHPKKILFRVNPPLGNLTVRGTMSGMTRRFDVRKIRKLADRERYAELYFYWREAEQMIASNFPQSQRYGRRLKKRVEHLYESWFGGMSTEVHLPQVALQL